MDSGSTWSAVATLNPPTGIQSHSDCTKRRLSAERPRRPAKTTTENTNDPPATSVANPPDRGSPRRLPRRIRRTKPARGKAGITHAAWSTTSALQDVQVVSGGAHPPSVDRHDDPEPDDDLGRGDAHTEEAQGLAAIAVGTGGKG